MFKWIIHSLYLSLNNFVPEFWLISINQFNESNIRHIDWTVSKIEEKFEQPKEIVLKGNYHLKENNQHRMGSGKEFCGVKNLSKICLGNTRIQNCSQKWSNSFVVTSERNYFPIIRLSKAQNLKSEKQIKNKIVCKKILSIRMKSKKVMTTFKIRKRRCTCKT